MAEQKSFDDKFTGVLKPLEGSERFIALKTLGCISYESLMLANVANPQPEHSLVCSKHSLAFAPVLDLDSVNMVAIALLHDIAPVPKIRKADVALVKDENERNGLQRFLRIVEQLKNFSVITYGWQDIVRSDFLRDYIMTKEMLGMK